MLLIQTIFGSDTKILTEDEITEGYLDKEFRKVKDELDTPSWSTEFSNEYYHIANQERELLKQALALPQRCRTGRTFYPEIHTKIMATETTGEFFERAGQKGVLLFSEKGDAYRFCFANENGGTVVLSPFTGLSLFKSARGEKALPVTEGYYPMYERAKGSSGTSSAKTSNSRNIIDLINKIHLIKNTPAVSTDDKKYLDNLRKAAGALNALPLYYIRQLLGVDIGDAGKAMAEFKYILAEEYLSAIIEKDNKIMNETENVILSEQFI
jgi:hypothetical protein